MTVDELTATIGPPAPDRVRVVMKARGAQPPRVHPDYRALLNAPVIYAMAQPVEPRISATATAAGLLVLLAVLLMTAAML